MEPVGLTTTRGKGLAVVHRCVVCGATRTNKIAADTIAPDEIEQLTGLPPA